MRNRRLRYEELKAYASNTLFKFSQQERRETFSWAYGLIEEIQKTYSNCNGKGLNKLNGVFEEIVDSLRSQKIDQVKKLSLIAILDESAEVRKLAVVLLLSLATKIANSKKTPSKEEVQLAHDIFKFVISYMKDGENIAKMMKEDTSLLSFILNKSEAYCSVISSLALFEPVEDPVSANDWKSMISNLIPGSVRV